MYKTITHTVTSTNLDVVIDTVPTGKAYIISNISVCNPATFVAKYSIKINGTYIIYNDVLSSEETSYNTNGFIVASGIPITINSTLIGLNIVFSVKEVDNI